MKQPNDKISESVDIEEREYWDEEDDGLLVKNSKVNKEYGILLLFCSMNCFIQSISFFCIFLESSIKNQYFNSFNFSFTLVLLGYNCYYFILKSKECDFYYKNNDIIDVYFV